MINPLIENPIVQAEHDLVLQIYDTGYEVYDTAEHVTHGMVSVGNLLRLLQDILKRADESATLKTDERDARLIMYLEDLQEQLNTCGEILKGCENSIRDIRTGLAYLDYKKAFPQKESDGKKQATLEVGA